MADKKRKTTSSSSAAEPSAKQQKSAPLKERAGGWLRDLVKQQRTETKGMKFNKQRLRFISGTERMKQGSEGVLYWMLRDHRVQGKRLKQLPAVQRETCSGLRFLHVSIGIIFFVCFALCVLDNWALVHAQRLAVKQNLPLHVCFCLDVPKSELSTLRHYSFMLKGLAEVAKVLTEN